MTPLPLARITSAEHFGGKAYALGRAIRGGLPVPEGWALPASWGLEQDRESREELLRIAAEVGFPMSVRSSACGEDSSSASFAGQHVTKLHVVDADALVGAIREVHDSVRASEGYRRKLGIGGAEMGIVLQRMVAARAAGVMFTRDPTTGADEFVVEASWGLGEAVVAGLVDVDRYRIARSGELLDCRAGRKEVKIEGAPQGGTVQTPVAQELATIPCLSDAELAALHRLALSCETVFGPGLDIEWACTDDGVCLLQCRPITVR